MKILAMGGGENGRPGKPYEIKMFDEEIVKMTGRKNPNFLFIAFTQKSAESAETYAAVAVSKVSPLPEPDYVANPKAKPPVPANPAVDWIEGKQLYYTVYYQGELTFSGVNVAALPLEKLMENNFTEAEAGALSYDLFNAGITPIEVKVLDAKGKVVSSKLSIRKSTDIDVRFDSVDGINVT